MNSSACFINAKSLRPWKVLQSLSLVPSSVHVFSVSRYFLHSPRYYTNWTRLLLTCVIPIVALVFFNTKIFLGIRCLALFYHFGCAAFVLFSRYFALNRTSSFLWYFVTPLINIDTTDSLSLDALTYSSFHPNGMSNSRAMNERNNSLPSEFNSNTQIHRQDTILPLSQHKTISMQVFCVISLGLWNM